MFLSWRLQYVTVLYMSQYFDTDTISKCFGDVLDHEWYSTASRYFLAIVYRSEEARKILDPILGLLFCLFHANLANK